MELQALIFDVDGTLADTEAAHLAAFNHAFARTGRFHNANIAHAAAGRVSRADHTTCFLAWREQRQRQEIEIDQSVKDAEKNRATGG